MPEPPPRQSDWWRVLGIVLIVIIVVAGLAFVAFAMLFAIAWGSYGSNK